MGKLLIEVIVAVSSFSMLLTGYDMFLSKGPLFFIASSLVLSFAIFLIIFNIGNLFRDLFCVLTRIGAGPSIAMPPLVLMKQNGTLCIKPLYTFRALSKPVASYQVVRSYLSGDMQAVQRYRWAMMLQLLVKLALCLLIAGAGLGYHNPMATIFGLAMLCFFLDLSVADQVDAVGEWTIFRHIGTAPSAFSRRFFAAQIVLYLLEDEALLRPLIRDYWATLQSDADRERLADILYYVYLAALADPSLSIPQGFTDEVQDLLCDWAHEIMVGTYQWWFIQLYLVWSHRCDMKDSRDLVIRALRAELKRTDMPTQWLKKKRTEMLDFIIMLAEKGYVDSENKPKYKVLYKNYYCHISPAYREAYRRVQQECLRDA